MMGPKAENVDLFRQLVIEAVDDHLRWRCNFYPADNPAISSSDKNAEQFRNFENRLHDLLFEFLADAKSGVPFFSPSYLGHMNTDLLLPGLVGFFVSMLYNQNNVAGESSPMTCRLEHEVVAMLARMVGFLPHNRSCRDRSCGRLCEVGELSWGRAWPKCCPDPPLINIVTAVVWRHQPKGFLGCLN